MRTRSWLLRIRLGPWLALEVTRAALEGKGALVETSGPDGVWGRRGFNMTELIIHPGRRGSHRAWGSVGCPCSSSLRCFET